MVLDLSQITGIGPYETKIETLNDDGAHPRSRTLFLKADSDALDAPKSLSPSDSLDLLNPPSPSGPLPVFLVDNLSTIELRCDDKLSALLTGKYESVMKSRYFGSGGIEIVLAGHQLTAAELDDLIRLSYNLTK